MRQARFVSVVGGLALVIASAMMLGGCSKEEGLKIKRIDPKQGDFRGGGAVTIFGTGFQSEGTQGVRVYFGNRSARVLGFDGDERLRVLAPGGKDGDVVDITVVFDDARQLSITKAYKYVDPQPLNADDLAVPAPEAP